MYWEGSAGQAPGAPPAVRAARKRAPARPPSHALPLPRLPCPCAQLYVALFIASNVTWTPDPSAAAPAARVSLAQETGYPYAARRTTRLTVIAAPPGGVLFSLLVRVPAWATVSNTAALNGAPLPGGPIAPGTWLNVTRTWAAGDVLDALFEPQASVGRGRGHGGSWLQPRADTLPPSPPPAAHI